MCFILPDDRYFPVRVRSLVGLMPLLAVETIEPALLDALPGFKQRLEWYLANRPDLCQPYFTLAGTRRGRTPSHRAHPRASDEMFAATDARS